MAANVRITFAGLQTALQDLGFDFKPLGDYLAFREPEQKALIVLPPLGPDDPVSSAHMIMVRNTVVGMGVATDQELQQSLDNARAIVSQTPVEASKPVGTNGAGGSSHPSPVSSVKPARRRRAVPAD